MSPEPDQHTQPQYVVAADGSGDFRCVVEAIARTERSAKLLVRPGEYRRTVRLKRRALIEGDGPADSIILAGGLQVRAGRVRLRGVTLTGPAHIERARLRAKGCFFRGEPDALHVTGGSANARLIGCH